MGCSLLLAHVGKTFKILCALICSLQRPQTHCRLRRQAAAVSAKPSQWNKHSRPVGSSTFGGPAVFKGSQYVPVTEGLE